MKVDIAEIAKVELKKNDVLVVETREILSDMEFAFIKREFIKTFKKVGVKKPHILITNGIKLSIVKQA